MVAKRNIIRFLSHEMRTPLYAVNMGLMVIKKELADPNNNNIHDDIRNEVLNVVDEIDSACNTSLDILNDLLTYEKIDAGILILEKEIIDLFSILHKSLRPYLLQVS